MPAVVVSVSPAVVHVKQPESQCWAACIVMVAKQMVDSPWGVSEVVEESGYHADSRRGALDYEINRSIKAVTLGNDKGQRIVGTALKTRVRRVTKEDVLSQLGTNRPFVIAVEWKSGGAHVVVVSGWANPDRVFHLWVHDPGDNEGKLVAFSDFVNNRYENNGAWVSTITFAKY